MLWKPDTMEARCKVPACAKRIRVASVRRRDKHHGVRSSTEGECVEIVECWRK